MVNISSAWQERNAMPYSVPTHDVHAMPVHVEPEVSVLEHVIFHSYGRSLRCCWQKRSELAAANHYLGQTSCLPNGSRATPELDPKLSCQLRERDRLESSRSGLNHHTQYNEQSILCTYATSYALQVALSSYHRRGVRIRTDGRPIDHMCTNPLKTHIEVTSQRKTGNCLLISSQPSRS